MTLEERIIDFIKQNPRASSIDICDGLLDIRVDLTYTSIDKLKKEERIRRINHIADGANGHHHYVIGEIK